MKRGLVISLFCLIVIMGVVSALSCGDYSYESPDEASASSTYSSSLILAARNAVDEDIYTHWYGEESSSWENNPRSITLTLLSGGEEQCVNAIKMMVSNNKDVPLTFNIDVYDSVVEGYVTIEEGLVIEEEKEFVDFNFADVSTGYVRITETDGPDDRTYGTLTEIYVNIAEVLEVECTTDSDCATGAICKWDGTCVVIGVECTSNADCDYDEVCLDHECVYQENVNCWDNNGFCTSSIDCADVGGTVLNYNCISPNVCCNKCITNTDCDSDEVCINGLCYYQECTINADCYVDEVCTDNECVYQECSQEGGTCGTIQGLLCCSGLECELEGDYPDAGGTCIGGGVCGDGYCNRGYEHKGDIKEGETVKVKYGGFIYSVYVASISYNSVRITVDRGEPYTSIRREFKEKESFILDGLPIYVLDLDYINPKYEGIYSDVSLYFGEDERTCPDDCFPKIEGCHDLLEKVINPTGFVDQGIWYSFSWSNVWQRDWWYIDGQRYSYTEYSARWYTNRGEERADFSYNIVVFDDDSVNLESYLKDRTSYRVCKTTTYWGADNTENVVYICNWDVLREEQNLDEHQYKSRQVLWTQKNILVEINTHTGRWLSDEEVEKIAQKRFNDFLNDLKDNRYDYLDWSNFDINWPLSRQVELSLAQCPSDVPKQDCYSCWECKTEPIICPPHGEQTRRCVDPCCDSETRVEVDYCSPGICSGCYIPKWFGESGGWSPTRCIPYGFRFGHQTGWDYDLEEVTEEEILHETDSEDDYTLEIISESEAILTLYSEKDGTAYEYALAPGETIVLNIPDWEEDIEDISITVNEIVVGVGDVKGYVDLTVNALGWRKYSTTMNAYCDIDGQIKRQKTVDFSGGWARCQNDYECESNMCSSGECIEIGQLIEEASAFKRFAVRLLCRLFNPINSGEYEECVEGFFDGEQKKT